MLIVLLMAAQSAAFAQGAPPGQGDFLVSNYSTETIQAAGTYDLQITGTGGSPVLIDPAPVSFAAGDVISAFAAGEGANEALGVFALPPGDPGFFLPLVQPDPEADISPASFSFTVDAGDVADDVLSIANVASSGAANLAWSIEADEVLVFNGRFDGAFDPSNWTFENSPAGVNGSLSVEPGPPVEVFILGGNDGVGGTSDLFIEIPRDGTITFDWGYQSADSGEFDSGGYVLNGDYTVLAFNNTQVPFFAETATVEVSAGDIFAFRVQTNDGLFGAGELGITNFEFTADLCAPAGGSSWLTATPASGSTAAGDSDAVTVEVDTAGLAFGHHEAVLCVSTNDPDASLVVVPVSLEVVDPTLGMLQGTVLSLGYCSQNPVALEGATVTVLGDAGGIWSTTSDAIGFFSLVISEDESPVEVLVEHPDHLSESATGIVIEAGETTVADFDLALDASCATVTPETVATTVFEGAVSVEQLEIGNVNGGGDLVWSLETAEVPAGFRVLEPFSADPIRGGSPDSENLSSLLGGTLPSLAMARGSNGVMVVDCESEPGIIIQDDGTIENGYSSNPESVSEVRFVDRYTPEEYPAFLTGVCVAFVTISGTTSFDVDIVVYDDSGAGGAPGTELGSLAVTVDVDQIPVPLPPDLQPQWTAIDLSALDIEVASGSVFVGVRFAPQNPNYFIASDQSPDRPAGFAGGFSWNSGSGVWGPIQNINPDYRSLMVRPVLVTELEGCDAPEALSWLSVDPETGIVSSGDSVTVDVIFDPDGLVEGVYQALLCLNSNDPVNPIITIPVTMTVVDEPPALLQVAHLAPVDAAGTTVDIALNGNVVLSGVEYGDSTGYLSLLAGTYTIEIFPANETTPLLTVTGVELEAGVSYSALANGDADNQAFNLILLVDDHALPAAGNFKLRLGHLAPFASGAAPAEVRLADGTLLQEVDFGDVTGFVELAAGTYDLQITGSGGSPVLIDPAPVSFAAGGVISAFATGEGANEALGVFALPPGDPGFFLPLVAGELLVDPTALAFGEVTVGESATLDFAVSNAAGPGAESLTLDTLVLSGDAEFAITGGDCAAGTVLVPGASCLVEVSFTPDSDTAFSGNVAVATAAGQSETVVLTGEGKLLPAELVVAPTELDFGDVAVTLDETLSFEISNAAQSNAASLTLSAINLSGAAQFAITGGDCAVGAVLAPSESCTVEVTFTPTAAQTSSGAVTVTTSSGSETVMLDGEGFLLPDELFSDRFEAGN